MMPRPRPRVILASVLAGAIVGFSGWLVGIVVADAVLLAVLATVVLVVPSWVGVPDTFDWPRRPERITVGGWYEVRRLESALQRPDDRRAIFATRVAPRLRAIAEAKLARRGVAWRDPAASRLLGPDVYAMLDDPGSSSLEGRRPPLDLAELVLGRLDEIADPPDPDRERTLASP